MEGGVAAARQQVASVVGADGGGDVVEDALAAGQPLAARRLAGRPARLDLQPGGVGRDRESGG